MDRIDSFPEIDEQYEGGQSVENCTQENCAELQEEEFRTRPQPPPQKSDKIGKALTSVAPLIDMLMRDIRSLEEPETRPVIPPRAFGEGGRLFKRVTIQLVGLLVYLFQLLCNESSLMDPIIQGVRSFREELGSGHWDREFADADTWVEKSVLKHLLLGVFWALNRFMDYNRIIIPLVALGVGMML
jgi:hypothetical protein